MNIKEIHLKLENLLKKSYSPYSGFKVACLLEDLNGNLYEGVNIENASYGATICAERSAIANAVTKGVKKIVSAYVMTSSDSFIPPCGICLQTLAEFMTANSQVVLFNNQKSYKIWKLENLLPLSFTKKDLLNE